VTVNYITSSSIRLARQVSHVITHNYFTQACSLLSLPSFKNFMSSINIEPATKGKRDCIRGNVSELIAIGSEPDLVTGLTDIF